jgi:hypothetical protein
MTVFSEIPMELTSLTLVTQPVIDNSISGMVTFFASSNFLLEVTQYRSHLFHSTKQAKTV